MQILRLLAARHRAASAIDAAGRRDGEHDDEGPFFDLDFSACSVRASSFGSGSPTSGSDSDSDDDERTELDFVISLQRSHSASPLKFRTSEPPARADSFPSQQQRQHCARKRGIGTLRTLSFGARSSSSGRRSLSRSSSGSARSLRLLMGSPPRATGHEEDVVPSAAAPSRDVIRRCLARISRRLRSTAAEARGLRRLRKCRSASSAAPRPSSVTGQDDSAVEKQDGIAGAIAHCKDSLHRASVSECESPLLRSRSDPGKCEAA